MNFIENEFGHYFKNEYFFAFFGKKNCLLQNLVSMFPNFEFREIQQTHSDIVIESSQDSQFLIADSHWTSKKNIALVVKSADCIPILVFQKSEHKVAAVHAGWRGVSNLILPRTLKRFDINNQIVVFSGPHICKSSFEVGSDVKNLILSSANLASEKEIVDIRNQKFYIDLVAILKNQVKSIANLEFHSLHLDTKTNLNFHSFRRDKENAGRNLSFICLLT